MNKPWLNSYPKDVPAEIESQLAQHKTFLDFFTETCTKYANNVAYENFAVQLRYAEVEKYSQQLAAFLQQQLKLAKGERVALMMPNILAYPVSLFAAWRAGLVVVNINPLYTEDELIQLLSDAKVSTLIVMSHFAHTVQSALQASQLPLKHIIITELSDFFPWPKRQLTHWVIKYLKRLIPSYQLPQAISLRSAMRQGEKLKLMPGELSAEDTAFIQYTGGTTGLPKGAVLSHGNIVANILQIEAWFAANVTYGKEVMISPLPMYHIFSLTVCCLMFFKLGGRNVLITNPRDLPAFIKVLAKVPFTFITGVNTLYNALLNHVDFDKINFSSLRIAVAGGMPLQDYVANQWQQRTGVVLLEGYGLTETSPVVSINPLDIAQFNGSIGLPVPSTEVKLLADGELCIKGPQVMRGYWRKPEQTRETFTEDGWFKTGDIASMDEAGYLKIIDRKKDMVIVSGFNVYPAEVENVLAMLESVLEVAVIGVPDAQTGEAVKAFIVPRATQPSEETIIAHCREHLAAYKVPKQICYVKELPKNNVGKVLRRLLRDS
jgi:long-chain acyl-CoA synthetase